MLPRKLLKLSSARKKALRILFLAKWAESDGSPDAVDGTHATYHAELHDVLRGLGFQVEASSRLERLWVKPDYDYLFSMFNRAEFLNSEMYAPLLATLHQVPFFGASPIIRGMSDDKHLMKLVARRHNLATADWQIYRRGCLELPEPDFAWPSLVVKPNASSASWGIVRVNDWSDALEHIHYLHASGHDAIVEAFVAGNEYAVPVIGSLEPTFLPLLRFAVDDPFAIRSYQQKRHLDEQDKVQLHMLADDDPLSLRLQRLALAVLPEIWPFDIGRFEFKYDQHSDTLNFIELNLSCNLWSQKASSIAARSIGIEHSQLIETLVCHSLLRQQLISLDELDVTRLS